MLFNAVTLLNVLVKDDDDTTSHTTDTPLGQHFTVKTAGTVAGICTSFVAVIIVGIIYYTRRQKRELRRNTMHER